MKSHPNIAAINTHTHSDWKKRKKKQPRSPKSHRYQEKRPLEGASSRPGSPRARGFPAPTARGYEVRPHHDAKGTGETSARAVGAPERGGAGWGGTRGRCWR